MFSTIKVISMDEEAFFALIDKVVAHVDAKNNKKGDPWVDRTEAMRILGIKSKTTLQKLRTTGQIKFSQAKRRNIQYDRDSLYEYLERHAKERF